jgi:putative dehydrogenase
MVVKVTSQRVGLIGLGAMGRGVAQNLVKKGFSVIGYDVRSEMKSWLEEQGASFAENLAELGSKCNIIISFVVNDAQTDEVLFGSAGLGTSLQSGSIFIACSTMAPAYVGKLACRLNNRSIRLLDAPVTGGAAGAAKGTLTIMAAGERGAFDEAKAVLEAFGARVYFVGEEPGVGSRLKVINQLLCGVHLAAAGEALALAKRQGLPLDLTYEVVSSGAGFSWMLGDRGLRMTNEDFSDVKSAVNIFIKDLGLVLDTAKDVKFSTPLASAAFNAFLSVSGDGMGTWDDSAVIRHYASEPYSGEIPVASKEKK